MMQGATPSPLVAIKQKEFALAAELAAAKQTAQGEIDRARRWAAAHVRHAEQEAREAAAIRMRTVLQSAEAEALLIRTEGERAATLVAQRGRPAVAQAVQQIMALVLPPIADAASSDETPAIHAEERYA